ncbi:epimerase [Alkalimonas collagenimarina]|uniref:Epimerase n=1 Tax=Alkalimonas collagenimarina TaxID=400390 RepID=A0ABT9GVI0_9GAMM|nr:epimerase [Alkalimonas collagenimarina]MDP4535046.1 epimerase [Alkalimonas collagenimarina]
MKVILVGVGWLGQQLLDPLKSDGHRVLATRQSAEGLASLPPDVQGGVLRLPQEQASTAALNAMFKGAVVICSVPPGWRKLQGQGYLASLTSLAELMDTAGSLACIHLSSTGVYQGLDGEVTEKSSLQLSDAKADLLFQGEQRLRQSISCCTLRLGGLIGPDRHPGKFLAGRLLSDPAGAVNMVHSTDVIAAIRLILQQQSWPAVFNLCCPEHVSRQHFYQQAAAALALAAPIPAENSQTSRRVIATSICQQLGFSYHYASALEAVT